MMDNEFVALSDTQSAAIGGGWTLDGLISEAVKVIVSEGVKYWSDFTHGVPGGSPIAT